MRKRGKMKKTFVGAVAALLFMFCFSLHPVSAQAAEHMLQMENDEWVCYTAGQRDNSYTGMAVNEYGKGRAVYISGLPYSFENNRVLHRAIMWSTHSEDELKKWFSTNYNVDVHAYPKNNKYCVVNNTDDPQSTTIYRGDGSSFDLEMEPNGIIWYEIQ